MRLDLYMAERSLAVSRAKAHEMILNGAVSVNGRVVKKPAYAVAESDTVAVSENPLQKYVSRGGLKLEAALEAFKLSPRGMVALDIGASSGGFTDCLLQYGAAMVYAVDSGTAQLHPSLIADARVQNREGTNARYLSLKDFSPPPTFAVMDVSFISQTILHPVLADILPEGGTLITLIKPQFELEKGLLGKNGIVKQEKLRLRAVERVKQSCSVCGFRFLACMESAITGGDGNVEYIAAFERNKDGK